MAFLTLDALLLPPPLPALLGPAMTLGLLALSRRLGRALLGVCSALDQALVFLVTVAFTTALLHALAWGGWLVRPALAGAGWMTAALGLVFLVREARPWLRAGRAAVAACPTAPLLRWMAGASAVTALGLGLAALGPATDADSLDYHLGVPLDWLRQGAATAHPEWLHARLVGLGESINLWGLAAGTDNLGACLQAAGGAVALVAVLSQAREPAQRVLGATLVLACPVLLFLVPNQKPQLLPTAATTAVLALFATAERLDGRRVALGAAVLAWTVTCKHSFLLSAGVVGAWAGWAAWRQHQASRFLGALLASAVLLPLPLWWRNTQFYGDPLSPFLERFTAAPNPVVVAFAAYLRNYGGAVTPARLLRLPVDVVFTPDPGAFTTVLGLGMLGALVGFRAMGPAARRVVGAAAACGLVQVLLGQVTPRFFLEPYLWCALAVVSIPVTGRAFAAWRAALAAQLTVTAAAAVVAAGTLLPGSLSTAGRDSVLAKTANGYQVARWTGQVLPADTVILDGPRSHALMPWPVVVGDVLAPPVAGGDAQEGRLVSAAQRWGVNTVLLERSGEVPPAVPPTLARCSTEVGRTQVHYAARNPFNQGEVSTVVARRLVGDLAGCFHRPAAAPVLGPGAPIPENDEGGPPHRARPPSQ